MPSGVYTRTEEHKWKSGATWRGKKRPKFSEEWCRKISLGLKGKKSDEKHHDWKGDGVGYRALHAWIIRKLGKAKECEECGLNKVPVGMTRYFQWANISHKYKRDLTDWKQLCVKCHMAFDGCGIPKG